MPKSAAEVPLTTLGDPESPLVGLERGVVEAGLERAHSYGIMPEGVTPPKIKRGTNRVYLTHNVWDAALERVRWLYQEFDNIYVNMSGGKDSTVVMHLALIVAEETGRLPLDVVFLDQEAEWGTVIDYMRLVMNDPRVRPHWLQVPLLLFNATSTIEPWLHCWDPSAEDKWIRPKEPNSIHDNVFGTDRFTDLLDKYMDWLHPNEKTCNITGVRAEESPARAAGLTNYETYKGETWGAFSNKKLGHYLMHPIYDWSYKDVWKAIHDNGWPYCKLYDAMYQYGVPIKNMRVSNLHHETAVRSLFYAHELEADTWEKVTARMRGVNTAKQLQWDFYAPKTLPPMFEDWAEYRDHLLENLIEDVDQKQKYRRMFDQFDARYEGKALADLRRIQVSMILVNDYHGTKLSSFVAAHMHSSKGRGKNSGRTGDRALGDG